MKGPADIAGYFELVASLLARCRVIESQEIRTQKRTISEGYLRGEVLFKDGSRLHFRELVSTNPTVRLVSYAYQYMRADGTLTFRYDDTDHFPDLPGAPHHKHVGETEVIASEVPDLEFVLKEIERAIKL